ncbi:GH25 family lysozyme [uncultured Paracoccus sp.]|uniref:glycoside hydrolase family 25 protein n=1 Tax=uncultured Paracoccus sp. TaxID=189685 RepID=UPI002615FBAA|nr:GH25 family lysozyme [uncultured Paracoccus sp.]
MRRLLKVAAVLSLAVLAACGGPRGPVGPVPGSYIGGAVPQLGDTKPHVWTSGHPYNLPVHGVDVSRYQGQVDWARARQAGISFAFLKATEGGDHADPAFRRYWEQTRAVGMPRGAYHFYYFCRSGAEQAAWFIANVPRERGTLPPVVDLEWVHTSRTCRFRPSPAEIHREVGIFMSALQQYYGQRPIVYTTVDFYREADLRQLPAEFWLRSVADHPRSTYPGQRWTFWQYSGTGTAPGFNGNVDLNAFAGTAIQWQQWLNSHLSR